MTGLALAVLGIYGVIAFTVTRRTREMGIRIALGAGNRSIVRAVLSAGLKPVTWGLGAGLPLSVVGARATAAVLRDLPIPLNAGDPVVFAGVGLILSAAALAAMLRPAMRAAGVEPMEVLRQE